ncbi:MAG: hypothetical protein IPG58_11505 [Acidobacteria bacterium]|nr:hypothetical protein [Acidobacteriota bacterium]
MKRFIFSVLAVSVFFLGLGALVEKTGAKFKSDEKALDLVRKARVAIGGDAAINAVQSMTIVGRSTHKIKINGVESTQEGETEIAMQLPDKLSKMVKIGKDDGTGAGHKMMNQTLDVVVVGDAKDKMKVMLNGEGHANGATISKKIMVKKDDGTVIELTGAEADKWIAEHPGVPGEKKIVVERVGGSGGGTATFTSKDGKTFTVEGKDSVFVPSGEDEKIIIRKAEGNGGTATFTSKDGKTFNVEGHKIAMAGHGDMTAHHNALKSNELLRTTLSLLLTAPQGLDVEYTYGGLGDINGRNCNIVVASFGGQSFKLFLDSSSNLPVAMAFKGMAMPKVMTFDKSAPAPKDGEKNVMVFTTKVDASELNDQLVKFSDYRSVNGVQLPFKWTQDNEIFDVTNYEINPANIGEKFQNQTVMVRTTKPDSK